MSLKNVLMALILTLLIAVPTAASHKMSEFPIVKNDQVSRQLKLYLGKSGGRRHMKTCFKRMKSYRSLISKRIKHYGLPQELLVIPVVESCYQNIHSEQGWGSGLWMFIRSTAKSYGLKVNEKTDQRLNVRLSTDAALKYLKANYKTFKNWELALLAYNVGEFRVKKAIKKTGSRNAWTLIRKGCYGDKDYLAKIMAVAIIMKNPKRLN